MGKKGKKNQNNQHTWTRRCLESHKDENEQGIQLQSLLRNIHRCQHQIWAPPAKDSSHCQLRKLAVQIKLLKLSETKPTPSLTASVLLVTKIGATFQLQILTSDSTRLKVWNSVQYLNILGCSQAFIITESLQECEACKLPVLMKILRTLVLTDKDSFLTRVSQSGCREGEYIIILPMNT